MLACMAGLASRLEYQAQDTTRSGTAVRIRMVRPGDRDELRATFDRELPEAMRSPRGAPSAVVTVGDWLAARAVGADSRGTLVATVEVGERERIVGAACFSLDPLEERGRAEIALGVAEPWRARGVGRLLLRHLIRVARDAGVSELYARVISANLPILYLIEKSDSPPEIDWTEAPPRARVWLGAAIGVPGNSLQDGRSTAHRDVPNSRRTSALGRE